MPGPSMHEFLAAGARSLVEAQLELDEHGRDSLDAFGETGVLPTVFTFSDCRLSCPVTLGLTPKRSAAERTGTTVAPGGYGTITLHFRYLLSPQGVDDPQPLLEDVEV